MKLELTLENKKAFFALYYNQNILNGKYKVYYNSLKTLNNRSFLLLNKLENIPSNIISHQIDFYRSKGYASNWNGITIEEQIEAGWIKLKQD